MSTQKTFADFTVTADVAAAKRREKSIREHRRLATDETVREYLAAKKAYKGLQSERDRAVKCGLAALAAVQELTGSPVHEVKDGFVLDGVTLATGMGWELNQRRDGRNILFIY